MTAAELIAKLQCYPPETQVVSFHEDLRTISHQIQKVHAVDYADVGPVKWIVIQAKGIGYNEMKGGVNNG